LFTVTFVGLTLALPAGPLPAAGWTSIVSLAAAKSALRLQSVRAVLSHAALSKHTWFYILSSPVVALLFEYNMIRSALGRDIVWRQIRYSLISPNKTLVLRPRGSDDADS
jgi:hypothetical protein